MLDPDPKPVPELSGSVRAKNCGSGSNYTTLQQTSAEEKQETDENFLELKIKIYLQNHEVFMAGDGHCLHMVGGHCDLPQ
jgi:hypothetical protein